MKGNQVPRIRIEPDRIGTDGKGAAMLMSAYGVTLGGKKLSTPISTIGLTKK